LYVGSTWYLARSPESPASRFAILRSLATGIYDSSTKPISLLNLAINLLCVLGGLDFVYRAHYLCEVHDLVFCRTGETTSTTAKLICRNPNSASTSLSVCDSSKNCREVSSEGGSDHTVIFEVSGLAPREQYTYTASNGCAGSLATSRVLEEMERFSLLSSSCMKPNWPYNPFNHALRIQGLEHVDSYLSTSMKDPEMMLFLGDFICESRLNVSANQKTPICRRSWTFILPNTTPNFTVRYTRPHHGLKAYAISLGFTCLTIMR